MKGKRKKMKDTKTTTRKQLEEMKKLLYRWLNLNAYYYTTATSGELSSIKEDFKLFAKCVTDSKNEQTKIIKDLKQNYCLIKSIIYLTMLLNNDKSELFNFNIALFMRQLTSNQNDSITLAQLEEMQNKSKIILVL